MSRIARPPVHRVVGHVKRSARAPADRARAGTKRALFGTLGGGRPDWIIVGAMKAGTTSLHHALHQSWQAVAPATKEVHYFDFNWQRGEDWYSSHFVRVPGTRTGEASPSYLFHPRAPERIASRFPDTRLIVLLREPVDRAYSHWGHQVRAGREQLSFVDAVEAEPERLRGADPDDPESSHRHYSYLSRGQYADQLVRLYDCFDRDQILVMRAEDVFDGFPQAVARVCEWLGLRMPASRRLARRNVGMPRPPMDDTLRRRLGRQFAASNRQLTTLVGEGIDW